MEASCHPAPQLQPVLIELLHVLPPACLMGAAPRPIWATGYLRAVAGLEGSRCVADVLLAEQIGLDHGRPGMAGGDAAIAAVLDELVQAASAHSEDPVDGGSATRVARTGQLGGKGNPR